MNLRGWNVKKNFMAIGKDEEGNQQYQYIGLDTSGEEFLRDQANDLYEDYQKDLELSETAKARRETKIEIIAQFIKYLLYSIKFIMIPN